MAVTITLNGVDYSIPTAKEGGWATQVTTYLQALATGLLSKAGGTFTLTADVNFGSTYGIKAPWFGGLGTLASTGTFRLANLAGIDWRNAAGTDNLELTVDDTDHLVFQTQRLLFSPFTAQWSLLTSDADLDPAEIVLGSAKQVLQVSDDGMSFGWGTLNLGGLVTNASVADNAAIDGTKISPDFGSQDIVTTGNIDAPTASITDLTADSVSNSDASPAQSGFLRLSNAGIIAWRSADDTTDLPLTVNSDDQIEFNGSLFVISPTTTKGDLIVQGDSSLLRQPVGGDGQVLTSDASFDTGLTWSSPLTNPMDNVGDMIIGGEDGASTALTLGSMSEVLQVSDDGTIQLWDFLSDANFGTNKISYATLNLTGDIVDADISDTAAIAYSKLSLTGDIVDADISDTAAIAYSKLSLADSITNDDISTSAGILPSKLSAMSAAQILLGNASGVPTYTTVTGDVTIGNTGVTAISTGVIVNTDISASAAIAYSKLASLTSANILVGSSGNVPTARAMTGDVVIGNTGVTAISTGVIVNTDISASAAIDGSKITPDFTRNITVANTNTTQSTINRSSPGGDENTTVCDFFVLNTTGVTAHRMCAFGVGNSTTAAACGWITATFNGGSSTVQLANNSDRRIKENIDTFTSGLDTIMKVRPVTYNMKNDPAKAKVVGFIAQEFVEYFPGVVSKTDNGEGDELPAGVEPWALGDVCLIPYMVSAIKQLKAEIDQLKQQLGERNAT